MSAASSFDQEEPYLKFALQVLDQIKNFRLSREVGLHGATGARVRGGGDEVTDVQGSGEVGTSEVTDVQGSGEVGMR